MPDQQPLRGADRVNDELEVGFDERFERRFHWAELAGRLFLVMVVALALSGLLGRGPFSHEVMRAPGGGASIDYEPVARYDTPTQVTLHLHPAPGQQTSTLSINTDFIEPMGLRTVQPTPLASAIDQGGITMTCRAPGPRRHAGPAAAQAFDGRASEAARYGGQRHAPNLDPGDPAMTPPEALP